MIFLYSEEASKELITLKGEQHKYLVKVRRHQVGDTLALRHKQNSEILYTYKIISIEPRSLTLELLKSEKQQVVANKRLHIGWCVIDNKSIEKVLASLNEVGVAKITFIYCDRSQKNFKPDIKRFERIVEASNQQCGRSDFMEFDICSSLEAFVEQHPSLKVFDFCENSLSDVAEIETVLIGCEGGFSQNEREMLEAFECFRLDTPLVLRSESAALSVAAKILL